jgi:hypothetical protein
MKQKKMIVILGIAVVVGLTMLGGISTKYFNSVVPTNAQQSQTNPFAVINQKARENKLNPSFAKSKEIAGLLVTNLLVLEIPQDLQSPITDQVANANMNGTSIIDESNIATAVNNLADQSAAPAYAYTNTEQVKVVRTFLHSLIPDVVKLRGNMDDEEAFAVFTATLSQKVDNDAFMVTPAEFTASMGNPANQPFPGSSAAGSITAEATQESGKANQMIRVVNSYMESKRRLNSNSIISMIGIN